MAAAAILKIAILVITHQPIVRFQRNFVWGSRTACRQGLYDKNCKSLTSKMADGRHFENRKSPYISEKSSDFDEIWYTTSDIEPGCSNLQSRDQKLKFLKFKMAAAAILKIAFVAINHRPIVRFQRNFERGSRTACWQGLRDKKCKRVKSKMADGRDFENRYIAISQWKIVIDEIWYTTSDIEFGCSHVTKN